METEAMPSAPPGGIFRRQQHHAPWATLAQICAAPCRTARQRWQTRDILPARMNGSRTRGRAYHRPILWQHDINSVNAARIRRALSGCLRSAPPRDCPFAAGLSLRHPRPAKARIAGNRDASTGWPASIAPAPARGFIDSTRLCTRRAAVWSVQRIIASAAARLCAPGRCHRPAVERMWAELAELGTCRPKVPPEPADPGAGAGRTAA
jgi:hypothetical protein